MIGPNQFLEVLSVLIQEQAETGGLVGPFRPDGVRLVGRYSGTSPEPLAIELAIPDGAVYKLIMEVASPDP